MTMTGELTTATATATNDVPDSAPVSPVLPDVQQPAPQPPAPAPPRRHYPRLRRRNVVPAKSDIPVCKHVGCRAELSNRNESGYCMKHSRDHRCPVCSVLLDTQAAGVDGVDGAPAAKRIGSRGGTGSRHACDKCQVIIDRIEWLNHRTWRETVGFPERQRRVEIYAAMVVAHGRIEFIAASVVHV